jgi:TRAP transporter TAXI family solute receptor
MTIKNRALWIAAAIFIALIATHGWASAQVKTRLSIATGGTGGVYYPLGCGMAALISKHILHTEATAEVTTASVDNVKLLHGNRVTTAFCLPDTAWEGFNGQLKCLKEKANIRTLLSIYSNFMHVVAIDGAGIKSVADLKGKRVSTGAPGSGAISSGQRLPR